MTQIIVFGSSRSNGNTRSAVEKVVGDKSIELLDLSDFDITPFDYEHRNSGDDFIPLMKKILTHDTIIIATPVYWYQMSSQHKTFFDRISDLLSIEKDLGRKLRGKNLYVIASFSTSYPEGFERTFEQICGYLGIRYLGTSFIYDGTDEQEFLKNNINHIAKAKKALGIGGR